MGEKIRDLNEINIGGTSLLIELNHSVSKKRKYDIHIQNQKFRMELPDKEFLQIASSILLAKKNLDIMKKGNL